MQCMTNHTQLWIWKSRLILRRVFPFWDSKFEASHFLSLACRMFSVSFRRAFRNITRWTRMAPTRVFSTSSFRAWWTSLLAQTELKSFPNVSRLAHHSLGSYVTFPHQGHVHRRLERKRWLAETGSRRRMGAMRFRCLCRERWLTRS